MQVFEAIKKRRSIRKFQPDKEISQKQVEKLLEAARWAPSAGNLQSYKLVIVREEKIKKELAAQGFVSQAPVVFVACADGELPASRYGQRGAELYAVQDATLALYNLWFAAVEMDLGACWVGAFDEEKVTRVLELPSNLRPVAILPVGYPAKAPSPASRKSIEEVAKII